MPDPQHIEVPGEDREKMAVDLQRLGLYAIANAVRSRRVPISEGVRHVRDYCLPRVVGWTKERRVKDEESPPKPGTVGASMLCDQEARRDALRAFLDTWEPLYPARQKGATHER